MGRSDDDVSDGALLASLLSFSDQRGDIHSLNPRIYSQLSIGHVASNVGQDLSIMLEKHAFTWQYYLL